MSSTISNPSALASPIYNPTIDSTSASIYNMMAEPSDELIAQYTQMITNLPTVSVYSGVLENPRTCDIQAAQSAIASLMPQLQSAYESNPANAQDPVWIAAMDPSLSTSIPSVLSGGNTITNPDGTTTLVNPNNATSALNDFQNQSDKIISNFPSILGMIQQALGIASALQGLLNPCLGLADFMGSVLDAGKAAMAQVQAAISAVTSAINAGIAAITSAIAQIQAEVTAIKNFISAEIQKLVSALIAGTRMGLSQLLSQLPNDPCAASLINSIGSGGLNYALSKV